MKTYSKTVLTIVSIFVVYTLIFTGYIYYSFSNFAFEDFYKRLDLRAGTIATMKLGEPEESLKVKETYENFLENLPKQKYYIFPVENNQIVGEIPQEVPSKVVRNTLKSKAFNYNDADLFYSGLIYEDAEKEKYVVVVSAENYFYSHHIIYLRNLLITSLLFSLLLIFVISHFVLRTLIRPVKSIIKDVNKIGSENLHLRLEVSDAKHKDPISELKYTFNDMLNRIETSFETQKNFISNASHELNTPLTSIIGEADLILSKERSIPEYEKALTNILLEAEKLEEKTKALLFLARTGYTENTKRFDKVRVDELLMEVQQNLSRVNKNLKIKMDFSLLPESPEKLKIKGNSQLLHLAISNIISNASKYSDNNEVYLALGATEQSVVIIIKDKGIGIPESEMPYIFDPYFRASNTFNYEGYGIGLPLSRNIIKMHNGELLIKSVEKSGTTVQIILPTGNYKL
ncbi:Signal transduction histidine kinase [Paenimyroides ummariense]|uniref:histidine kinase n=1 Tax=Paenimyroides ummariense TaxID=913024 RepID=A0A1I4Y5E9_9FLAO|nr:HAMP domain-containing sensor histidine kinase [Paenimyroides ummariense]SFN33247.1 Signal transduction histidine kinase [Paenimyroides ummariense]